MVCKRFHMNNTPDTNTMSENVNAFPGTEISEKLNTVFFPQKKQITPLPESSVDLEIPVSGNTALLGCRFHYRDKSDPVILFFHGNGETVADYDQTAGHYLAAELNLFVATYRGYGWSTGEPSVTTLFDDAAAILNALRHYMKKHEFSAPLFIMGRSLGSVSALDLACRYPDNFKALLIDSGFGDTLPVYQALGLGTGLETLTEENCFKNLEKIRLISMPTLIYHGARDQFIPVAAAEKLQVESGAKTKQFHVIPGADHNSLMVCGGVLYFQTIKKFSDTLLGKNTWRHKRKKFKTGEEKE